MISDLASWIQTHYGQEVMRPGIERMREVLKPLLPSLTQKRIVTIAGTNGKGETTLRLSELLNKTSHCAWTSPHIQRLTERFHSENGEINSQELKKIVQLCHEQVQKKDVQLSFYEFLFFVFCTWAVERKAQVLLLEVGLGGRLDAVNVLDAELVLLTSISRDHQEILGNRYELILKEKLGVLRSGKNIISFLELNYLREKVQALAFELKASHLDLEGMNVFRPFEFSSRNQLIAHAAFFYLKGGRLAEFPSEFKHSGWTPSRTRIENRGEVHKALGHWHFYGSHNPDGMRKLIQFLHSEHYNFEVPHFDLILTSFSKRSEKDVAVMLRMLKSYGKQKLKVCAFNHPKAFPQGSLEGLAHQEGIEFVQNFDPHNFDRPGQNILVVGSYYFLGNLRRDLCGG